MENDTKAKQMPAAVGVQRRNLLKAAGVTAVTSSLPLRAARAAGGNTIKVGVVSPRTGPLAVFAEPDEFLLRQARQALAKGIKIGGKTYAVEFIYKDSQSNSNRASEVASELITKDNVDLMLAASTPATTNPVADQCSLNGVPCVTNGTPWESYFFGRKGNPKTGFKWTYHYFWGIEDVIATYTSMWDLGRTNKVVGSLWPNDSDGNAWANPGFGFPPALKKAGFQLVDRGRFQLPANNFAAFISAFKARDVEIVTGVLPPPDFANFWNQAGQQGFRPKIVTAAKATEFYAAVKSFGQRADGLSVEVSWHPTFPFRSSLTGESAQQLADIYMKSTGRPWSFPLGYTHSLFEVAADVLRRAKERSADAILESIHTTHLQTVAGMIDFRAGPVPGIAKTPLTGGQWRVSDKGLELVLVENVRAPMVPITHKLRLLS